MADKRQQGGEEVPAFFKNMGSGSPKPRQKFCGMFCPVEGSSENKTINFDSLSACRGSGRVIEQQKDVTPSDPARKIEIKCSYGKEALQYLNDKEIPFSPKISSQEVCDWWEVMRKCRLWNISMTLEKHCIFVFTVADSSLSDGMFSSEYNANAAVKTDTRLKLMLHHDTAVYVDTAV
ncbi:hypothetical protein GDO81_020612 [Engystomops pustulosus]|uniref:Uncharacterized protein n=1 Tax=Engystomops pustulosus TaxID=76066 RepID=A0AAV6YXC4_ENGPU|nr:hypothetical protein GDO81_020612 [Engystomops pustulosus]